MTITETATHWARIYMAGPVQEAERICRDFCLEVGLCVTVTPTSYIYTGGQEAGFVVGFINYPRFPASADEIDAKAEALGQRLLVALAQLSFTVETPQRTRWFSRRQETPGGVATVPATITHEQALDALDEACDGLKDVQARIAIREAFAGALGVGGADAS